MRIELDLPDWVAGKPLYIVTNRELIAYSEIFVEHRDGQHVNVRQPWKIKTARCDPKICGGECCKTCVFYTSKGCGFGSQIPLGCLISDCGKSQEFTMCTENFS